MTLEIISEVCPCPNVSKDVFEYNNDSICDILIQSTSITLKKPMTYNLTWPYENNKFFYLDDLVFDDDIDLMINLT